MFLDLQGSVACETLFSSDGLEFTIGVPILRKCCAFNRCFI